MATTLSVDKAMNAIYWIYRIAHKIAQELIVQSYYC